MSSIVRLNKMGIIAGMTNREFAMILMQTAKSIICQINDMKNGVADFMGWDLPTTIRGIESQALFLYESIPVLADHRQPELLEPFEITTIKDALRSCQAFKKMIKHRRPEFSNIFKRIDWTGRDYLFYI